MRAMIASLIVLLYSAATSVAEPPSDVEVAIVDPENGTVVRHLAAGVLGTKAPPAFVANSRSQKLACKRGKIGTIGTVVMVFERIRPLEILGNGDGLILRFGYPVTVTHGFSERSMVSG